MVQAHTTYCRNCPSACGLLVDIEDNKITNIRGDARHALTTGYFCIKGQASMDLHNGEDRLTTTQARRADGQLGDIDIERALDEIHAKLSAIIERHGPRAVAMYYGTGANLNALCHSAMKGWLDQIGSPYIFSSMTVDQSAKWVTMGRMGYFVPGKHSALDADVLMEIGVNPAVSHQSSTIPMTNPMKWLREAQQRGLKLIVVDPRRTETARRADLHLQIKPGEDATLFAGLIRIVLEKNWHDAAFCDRFTTSLAALSSAVSDFTPDFVAERTGIEESLLFRAAEMFSRAKRKSAATGTGPNMSVASNLSEHLVEAFNAICGGYRRAGDVIRNSWALYGRAIAQEMVIPANRSWERGPTLRTVAVGPMCGEYPTPLLPREIIGTGEDKIRALIVVGGNPLKAIGDPETTVSAFNNLELLVTLDPRPTETAARSHYIIATSLPYERHDYTGPLDGYFGKTFAQVAPPIMLRPAGVIDDWEFFWGLAKRAGKPLELKQMGFGMGHRDIPGPTLTLDFKRKPTTQELIQRMCSQSKLSYDALASAPQGIVVDEAIEIRSAGKDDGARLDLCPDDVKDEIRTVRSPRDSNPDHPYRLIVRRQLESMNTSYSNASKTRRRYPVNPAFMHPDDMRENKLSNGDRIVISSAAGSVVGVAQADPSLRRQVVSMTHGWGALNAAADPEGETGAFTGRLVSLTKDLQSINYMTLQSAIPVSIEPYRIAVA